MGVGLQTICSQAFQQKYNALIFFDQDTGFNNETLDTINKFYSLYKNLLNERYSSVVFNSKNYNSNKDINLHSFNNVLLSRNSGSLYILKNLYKMNWHNERYFVDGVDYEFCLNSLLNNYRIGEYSCTPGFDHKIEQGDEVYVFFSRSYSIRKYSWSRILDTTNSSIKIICKAVFSGKFYFGIRITRLLIIYLTTQITVRVFHLFGV